MNIEITLAQIHSEFGQPQKNMQKFLDILQKIHPVSEHILILPELWSSGFDLKNCVHHAPVDAEILHELTQQAISRKIWIGGSYLTCEGSAYYNTFVYLGPRGEKAIYRKIHLIRLMNEQRWFSPGHQYTMVNTNHASIGLSICYDLRFPAFFQALAHAGCNLFLLPAAWPISRIAHWNLLLPARAVENQSFFAACNAVGSTHREIFGGSSKLVSPWGEILFQASQTDENIETTSIDMDEATKIRQQFPYLKEQQEDSTHNLELQTYQFPSRDSTAAI
jgi:omega-amidase